MNSRPARSLLILCTAVLSSFAFAEPETAPPAAAAPKAVKGVAAKKDAPAPAEAPAPAAKTINLEFNGPLREALKKIAAAGGINLVITGELNDPAEVMLHGASPEEALDTVASAHNLKVSRKGSIWTLRPMTEDEKESLADAKNEAADHDEAADASSGDDEDEANVAPVPPVPPVPAMPGAPDFGPRFEDRLKDKLMRKFQHGHRSNHGDGNDRVGYGPVTVQEGETVDDVVSYGGGVTVNGHVDGDAVAFGGGVRLGKDAEVEGDVVAFGGGVQREHGAVTHGDVIEFGGASTGKALAGLIKHSHRRGGEDENENENDNSNENEGAAVKVKHESGMGLPWFLVEFAVLFGVGFLAMMLAPRGMKVLAGELIREPLRCGLTGAVGALATGLMSVLLTLTFIGIPVAALLLIVVGLGSAAGVSVVASEIGTRLPLLAVRKTQAIVLAAGLLILLVVSRIPVIGTLAVVVISVIALGAFIRALLGSRKQGIPEPV